MTNRVQKSNRRPVKPLLEIEPMYGGLIALSPRKAIKGLIKYHYIAEDGVDKITYHPLKEVGISPGGWSVYVHQGTAEEPFTINKLREQVTHPNGKYDPFAIFLPVCCVRNGYLRLAGYVCKR
jgi:hypothetical protein